MPNNETKSRNNRNESSIISRSIMSPISNITSHSIFNTKEENKDWNRSLWTPKKMTRLPSIRGSSSK